MTTDAKQSRLEQIRRSHQSARPTRDNPSWVHTHNDLTITLEVLDELAVALREYVMRYQAFRAKPMGAPGSAHRELQDADIAIEDRARAVLAKVVS